MASTFVHELVHLLNRRALGPALPPWLDEGMADDLSYSRIDEKGELSPARLGGSAVDMGSVTIWKGGQAAALELRRAMLQERSVPLEGLLSLEWTSFVDPRQRLHYPQSALFIRYLVESEGSLKRGFRSFLEGIAAGGPVTPDALLHHLERDWEELDNGFRSWVLEEFVNPTS